MLKGEGRVLFLGVGLILGLSLMASSNQKDEPRKIDHQYHINQERSVSSMRNTKNIQNEDQEIIENLQLLEMLEFWEEDLEFLQEYEIVDQLDEDEK